MNAIAFGDDEGAAGVFVEAMDDTGALFAIDAGEIRAVRQESLDESAAGMTGAGVDDHPFRFVDN